jgi:hypothetical protein
MTVTAAVLLLLSGSAALSQSAGPESKPYPMQSSKNGSKQEKDACSRDASRYCSDAIPEGDMQVLACLKDHRKKLSKACEKVLAEHGQ